MTTCKVEDCDRPKGKGKRGWCIAHYARWQKIGDVQAHKPIRRNMGTIHRPDDLAMIIERYTNKVEVGCWEWTGSVDYHGYPKIQYQWKQRFVHRLVVEQASGPIPDGMVVDHLCMNRACINPQHLEIVTPSTNSLRGNKAYSMRPECKVEGCTKSDFCDGRCAKHYNEFTSIIYSHEREEARQLRNISEKLALLTVNGPDGCRNWIGTVFTPYGRPALVYKSKNWKAYRLLWTLERGEIPEGMTIDHLCYNRLCMNLDHMQVVSPTENNLRKLYRLEEEGKVRDEIHKTIREAS